MDDSSTSRNIVRNLDAFSQTGVVAHYSNVTDARIAMQEGKIYISDPAIDNRPCLGNAPTGNQRHLLDHPIHTKQYTP